ncbi:OmpH family outer membrane protein [Luteitalea sp.]
MKSTSALLFGACLLIAPTVAYGQPASPAAPLADAQTAFLAEGRVAFVDFNRVAAVSKEGKALASRIATLRTQKESEAQARSKEVASLESKLTQGTALLNDAAREQLRKQFEKAQVDFQRFTQDAQAEVAQVQRELEQAFLQKAFPLIGAVAKEKSLWAVFSVGEGGLVWREPALDISEEIAKRLDATAP